MGRTLDVHGARINSAVNLRVNYSSLMLLDDLMMTKLGDRFLLAQRIVNFCRQGGERHLLLH